MESSNGQVIAWGCNRYADYWVTGVACSNGQVIAWGCNLFRKDLGSLGAETEAKSAKRKPDRSNGKESTGTALPQSLQFGSRDHVVAWRDGKLWRIQRGYGKQC